MRKYKLPKKERKLWLEALNSGKFKQETGSLVYNRGYCCLGIYGKVIGLEDEDMKGAGTPKSLNLEHSTLFPKCLLGDSGGKNRSFVSTLVNMNDEKESSFKEIATYIKKHTIGV